MRRVLTPVFGLLLSLGLAGLVQPAAAKRVALVIGNDSYAEVPKLQKAVNDARAMEATLAAIGFDVIRAVDVTRRAMNESLQRFTARLEPGDEALFFYAGHGVEIDGRNYLLPTDIPGAGPGQEEFVKSESVAVDRILEQIRGRGARVSILVLDACRDNPFATATSRGIGGTRGLARTLAPEGSFIIYSAGVGQTALDRLADTDPHPNSVFTRSLIPLLSRPGLSLVETARQVRRDVRDLAARVAHEQRPAYYDEVVGDFYFAGRPQLEIRPGAAEEKPVAAHPAGSPQTETPPPATPQPTGEQTVAARATTEPAAPPSQAAPAPPAATAPPKLMRGRRFKAEEVPFVCDACRAKIAEVFASAGKHRALAINVFGDAGYAWGYGTHDGAVQQALSNCFNRWQRQCEVYAVNDTVLWNHPEPQLPPWPWAEPGAGAPFSVEQLTMLGAEAQSELASRYLPARGPKAIAVGPGGAWAYQQAGASLEEVMRMSLQTCSHFSDGGTCRIVAINDSLAAR